MKLAAALAAILLVPALAPAQDITGEWQGTLKTGVLDLRLAVHISKVADGRLSGTMDSLDQGAMGIPITSISFQGSRLVFQVASVRGSYEGTLEGATIKGAWTQAGSLPLALHRATGADEHRRPQNPVKPYPYREEDVSYSNAPAQIRLAATLTIPQGKGPFPAVLLITGSGPQDRDETIMGHKPFLVLADCLTRKGIAVLRADDRGVGRSGGTFDGATTADFAADAESGVAWLKTRPEIDPRKIGLIGHSEGGIIAPMVAARNPSVAFIVLLAGSGVPGDQLLAAQVMALAEAGGASHAVAEKNGQMEREVLALVKQEKDNAALEKLLREKLAGTMPEAALQAQLKSIAAPWFRYFIEYDPAPALRKVRCPVLALGGSKDVQVPAAQNLPAIRQALEAGGNKDFEVVEMPGLNHLFQTAKSGSPSEYGQIEETMSPAALERIAVWILKR
jgi:uncharacterized protein